ncbi:MAG: class IV adenylate cyclase [Bacillota bacterium]
MPSNLEVKATASDWTRQLARAGEIAAFCALLWQRDTFFDARSGRLKLREERRGEDSAASARLISYHRKDIAGPSQSKYRAADVTDPAAMRDILAETLGIVVTVEKRRHLFLAGQTRIHLDDVDRLGRFIEIECPLQEAGDGHEARAILGDLIDALGILPGHLLTGAYADMLLASRRRDS